MQWEFAGRLGPPPGRYVVRRYAGDVVREVVVVTAAEAPRRWARRSPAGTVPVTRVTVIDAAGERDGWEERAEATLARFLRAHRVAAADPYAPDPGAAVAVRAGTALGSRLAEGEWDEAEELPAPEPPKRPRRSRHRPGERLAALLAARDAILASEELTLRARADLDLGRNPEAALQLEAALNSALAELSGWVAHGDVADRLDELHRHAGPVAEAAAAAREGRLEDGQIEAVRVALGRLEAALRARALYAAE